MLDMDYYILTLAAIARELNIRKQTTAVVHLAVGLPLTWVGEQKEAFRVYLLQNEMPSYQFRGVDYHVTIAAVDVFPQGFTAVAENLRTFRGVQERESTSILNLSKRSELSQAIVTLIEKQEELHSERKQIMAAHNVSDDAEMKEQKKIMGNLEVSLQKLERSDAKYATEQEDTLAQYHELTAQAAELDDMALDEQRHSLRPAMMQEGRTRLQNAYGKRFDDEIVEQAMRDVHGLLGELDISRMTMPDRMEWAHREIVKHEPQKTGKERNEMER